MNGTPATTCVTGTLQQAGTAAANVLVRAAGVNYLGTSTGQTNAQGSFCLDVTAATLDGGAAQLTFSPEALAGGIPYTATQVFQVSAVSSGSCEVPGSSCTSLGAAITLTPAVSCLSGTITADGGPPATLDTTLKLGTTEQAYAAGAGIRNQAYVGQVTVGTNGSFCALSPPGSIVLSSPANASCFAPNGGVSSLTVPGVTSAASCSAGGCRRRRQHPLRLRRRSAPVASRRDGVLVVGRLMYFQELIHSRSRIFG